LNIKQLALLTSLTLPMTVLSHADTVEVDSLSQLLDGLHSYSADFKQTLKDDRGDIIQQSSGEMAVVNTGKLRWQTLHPFNQLVVTDGDKLWRYDADLEQATVGGFNIDLSQTPALLLSGNVSELSAKYDVQGAVDNVGSGAFTLIPTSKDSLFDQLTIHFVSGEVSTMELKDGFSQQTIIQFSDGHKNPSLNSDLFQFIPPPGTDVLVEQ